MLSPGIRQPAMTDQPSNVVCGKAASSRCLRESEAFGISLLENPLKVGNHYVTDSCTIDHGLKARPILTSRQPHLSHGCSRDAHSRSAPFPRVSFQSS